jgi:SM-20-related protein
MIYTEARWLEWIDVIAKDDYVVIDDFLSIDLLGKIHLFFEQRVEINYLRKASIGRGMNEQEINSVRGDYIYWLDRSIDTSLELFFEISDEMILYFNRYCYLNLKSSEFHIAEYPVGSFYKQHVDQFVGSKNRMITFLLYLNKDWIESDEGKLGIHENGERTDIAPINNRCIMFKSEKILHEVLPTNSIRRSLTGWLLYNPSISE